MEQPSKSVHHQPTLRLGYCIPPNAIPQFKEFTKTKLYTTLLAVLGDYLTIGLVIGLGQVAFLSGHFYISILMHPIIWYICALRLRGFETLLHDASHFNWTRRDWLNDLLANLLVALPVIATVRTFRQSHVPHHTRFGTDFDTDKMWLDEIRAEDIRRNSVVSLFKDIISRLGHYILIWWRAIRSCDRVLTYSLTWHLIVVIIPLSYFIGYKSALVLWFMYYVIPLVVFLPPIRLLVESSEHLYYGTSSVFEASITTQNDFLRWLLYPHNDCFHALHHLVPSIPHHYLKEAHAFLCDHDYDVYGLHNLHRLKMWETPVQAVARIE